MSDTLVLQSHKQPLPAEWIRQCLDSVESWASNNGYDYRFIGDEIFDYLTAEQLVKIAKQKVIATDLARLLAIKDHLHTDYQRVVWCDADFLIIDSDLFTLPQSQFAVGREVWVQQHEHSENKYIVNTKVHNAFLMFGKHNAFLDFYVDSAQRLLRLNQGSMPPQFIGPKLLTAIHNIVQLPVCETAGMLSPLVIRDIVAGSGPALKLFCCKSPKPIYAANLCASLVNQTSNNELERCVEILKRRKSHLFKPA